MSSHSNYLSVNISTLLLTNESVFVGPTQVELLMLLAPPNITKLVVRTHNTRSFSIWFCQVASHHTKRPLINPATSRYKQIRGFIQYLSFAFQFGTVSRPPYRMTGTLRCLKAIPLLRHAYACICQRQLNHSRTTQTGSTWSLRVQHVLVS